MSLGLQRCNRFQNYWDKYRSNTQEGEWQFSLRFPLDVLLKKRQVEFQRRQYASTGLRADTTGESRVEFESDYTHQGIKLCLRF